jgi:hypothetical protein
MRLASRSFALATLIALAGTACSPVDIHSPQIRGIGYVRLDEVVKAHPLYGQLAQMDDAIAAINLAAMGPQVPRSAAAVAADVKDLNAQLKTAQDRANKVLAQKQLDYGRKEQAAIAAALAAAGESGAASSVAAQMNATSTQQARTAAQQANANYMAYQQSLIAANDAAFRSISNQLQQQANRKYDALEEQLQQKEAAAQLRLSEQDAPERLSIKTRVSNLALDDATRVQLRDRMAALQKKEADATMAQRRVDETTLLAYRKQLQAQTGAAVAAAAARMRASTQSQLQSRRNEVTSQIQGLGAPQALPANLSAASQAKIQQIRQQFSAQFQADAQRTIDDYNATKSDLDRQYAALHGADVGATGAAAKQLADLQRRRGDLYDKIVAQIKNETARIAQQRGLNVVLVNVEATPGGYDLTNEVTKDIESLHE